MATLGYRPPRLDRAIAELCDRLVPDRHERDAIDLTALAKHLGVIDVLYKASRIHGYTTWSNRGAILVLAMANTEGRRRATLAHECGHLILNPAFKSDDTMDAESIAHARMLLGDDYERFERAVAMFGVERMCDRIAFELLLPRELARGFDTDVLGSAAEMKALATRLRVSLSLIANETSKSGAPVSLVRLARAWDDSWIVVDTAGDSHQWKVGATCDSGTNEALSRLPVAEDSTAVDLRSEGTDLAETYSVLRHRNSAIAVRSRVNSDRTGQAATPAVSPEPI